MEWSEIWKIILCAVGSAGGIGAIIVCAVKFASDIIAERLSQKYETKLQKELEEHRANLDGRIYITKAQYDAEFDIYRSLSKAFFEMILKMDTIFSPNYRTIDNNFGRITHHELERYGVVIEKAEYAQNLLYENGAFIPESLYQKYDTLFESLASLFWIYSDLIQQNSPGDVIFDQDWLSEKHKELEEIRKSFIALNSDLRAYLQGLTIVA